jgi:hypothetical protein
VDKRPIDRYSSLILSPHEPLIISFRQPPEAIKLLDSLRHNKN